MALKGRVYPTWLYSEKHNQGILVKSAQEEDDLGVPVFDNPNLGKPRSDQGYMKGGQPAAMLPPGPRRVKPGSGPNGVERRKLAEPRVNKAGVSPTGKERRIFPNKA